MTSRISPETMLLGFFEQNPRSASFARSIGVRDEVLEPFVSFDGESYVLDVGDENVLDERDLPAGEEARWIAYCISRAIVQSPVRPAVYKTPLS